MNVFEFGSGHSTLWWAARAKSVSAIEDDQRWFDLVSSTVPENVDLRLAADSATYQRAAADSGRRFDVIVVDGTDRNECALASVSALTENGVVIWDNADWRHIYGPGISRLEKQGFRELPFYGPGPINGDGWTTSVFYRPGSNCLGI